MGAITKAVGNAVGGAVESAVKTVGSAVSAAAEGVGKATSVGISAAKSAFEGITSTAGGVLGKALQAGLAGPGMMIPPGQFFKALSAAGQIASQLAAAGMGGVLGGIQAGGVAGSAAAAAAGAVGQVAGNTAAQGANILEGLMSQLMQDAGKLMMSDLKNFEGGLRDFLHKLKDFKSSEMDQGRLFDPFNQLEGHIRHALQDTMRLEREISKQFRV